MCWVICARTSSGLNTSKVFLKRATHDKHAQLAQARCPLTRGTCASRASPIIFEIANWKVQIENLFFQFSFFNYFTRSLTRLRPFCADPLGTGLIFPNGPAVGEAPVSPERLPLYLKLQIGKCKLKILFFYFSFFNYFTRSLTRGVH